MLIQQTPDPYGNTWHFSQQTIFCSVAAVSRGGVLMPMSPYPTALTQVSFGFKTPETERLLWNNYICIGHAGYSSNIITLSMSGAVVPSAVHLSPNASLVFGLSKPIPDLELLGSVSKEEDEIRISVGYVSYTNA